MISFGINFNDTKLIDVYDGYTINQVYSALFQAKEIPDKLLYKWELGKILKVLSNDGLIDRDIVLINIDRIEKCFGNGDLWTITGSMSNGSWMGTFNPKVENMYQKIRDLKLDDLLD